MLTTLGRLIARRAGWFVGIWVLLVVLGYGAATGLFGNRSLFDRLASSDLPTTPGESRDGNDRLLAADDAGSTLELLLDGVDPTDATLRSALDDTRPELAAIDGVASVADPYGVLPAATGAGAAAGSGTGSAADGATGTAADAAGTGADAAGTDATGTGTSGTAGTATGTAAADALAAAMAASPLVAVDGGAVLVFVTLEGDLDGDATEAAVDAATARLLEVADAVPGATGAVSGEEPLVAEIQEQVETDLRHGEVVALPLSLLVMVVVFGGFLAASLPIVGALAAIAGGLATLLGFAHVMDLDSTVPTVVTVMGLSLCIDYGLLLVSRFREELRRGHAGHAERDAGPEEVREALAATLGSAGRTVAFSAVTVAVSLCGLVFVRAEILRAIAVAGVSVVLVAMLVALTLVPALLALLGGRMLRPGLLDRVPGLRRMSGDAVEVAAGRGAFARLAAGVQRRPVLVTLGVLVALVVMAAPVGWLRLVSSGTELLPEGSQQRQVFEEIGERFPEFAVPAVQVVADAADADALQEWGTGTVAGLAGVAEVEDVTVEGEGDDAVAVLAVHTAGGFADDDARDLVTALRADRPEGVEVQITGRTPLLMDFGSELLHRAPAALGVVVAAIFVLLFLMTGSLLVPLKAVVMNLVSLGASFGVLVWVFQEGHLEGLLDFTSTGGIETSIPAIVVAFAFGLAMDYEVFLLSRIKESHDAGADNDTAVREGLQRSGRIITSAALIVVIVFAGFATGELLVIKEMGVALAVAVAVDATLVRMLLVPATMTLLGEWNWWAPAPLRRLHARFGISEG